MANTPKLIKIPGPFLDAVERLLQVAPPPKTAKGKADRAGALKQIKRARKRPVAAKTAKRKTARKAR